MDHALHAASVPVFLRYLAQLRGLVDAAERLAATTAGGEAALLAARLAPDMRPFADQVVIAANFSLRAAFPLVGEEIPPDPGFPASFDGLRARIDHTSALLRSLDPERFAGASSRTLASRAGDADVRLPAPRFLFDYALPNFFFHLGMAYAILRSRGAPIGKADFDGLHRYPAASAKESAVKKTLSFSVVIAAPRALVWDTLMAPDDYRTWTAAFCEGSHYEGSWAAGARIRFLSPGGDGMVAEIAENRPQSFVSIRHLGEFKAGVEDTTSDKVRAWAPAYENYRFDDVPGGTQVRVDIDTVADWESFMGETFPKALALLKELCERKASA